MKATKLKKAVTFIYLGVVWTNGSGWADGSKVLSKHTIRIKQSNGDEVAAKEKAWKLWHKRGYKQPECLELQTTINH
jgi:uncharacterized protein YdgA (DUF945 family)